MLHANEALGLYLRESANDPMAQKAGAAALQAIEATQKNIAIEQAPKTQKTKVERASFGAKLKDFFQTAFVPATASASALALFFVVGNAPEVKVNDADLMNTFLASAVPEVSDLEADEVASVLSDVLEDNHAEVQDLDSGTQVAAVFSTEAHNITVIWVPEPEEG